MDSDVVGRVLHISKRASEDRRFTRLLMPPDSTQYQFQRQAISRKIGDAKADHRVLSCKCYIIDHRAWPTGVTLGVSAAQVGDGELGTVFEGFEGLVSEQFPI